MEKIAQEEERLHIEMKQLKKQLVPDARLVACTKKRVFDADRVYHHTFLTMAIPTALLLLLCILYYAAYARPTANALYTQTIQQQKMQKKQAKTEAMTEQEKKEIYEYAGQEQGFTKKQIALFYQKGKVSTSQTLCKSRIGIVTAKITIETVTVCQYGSATIRLYEDKTAYRYKRCSKGWKLIQETIEQL